MMRGLDLLGALDESKWVHSVNTAAFRANMMSSETPGDVGADEPAFLMQPGEVVHALGPAVPANNKVPYVPCAIPTRGDGVFWVRSSSLGGPITSKVAAASIPEETKPGWLTSPAWAGGPPRWQVGLVVLASALGLGLAAKFLGKPDRQPRGA